MTTPDIDVILITERRRQPMEYKLIIDEAAAESLVLTVHERNPLVESIEKLLNTKAEYLTAYTEDEVFRIAVKDVDCFYTDSGRVCALVGKERFTVRYRLYALEEILDGDFVKINQGCIVNVNAVKKFEASVGGAIKIILGNGFEDYISRRELSKVKRRFGL